ncbi:MAG: hypothetical protein WC767_01140 [Candidatus Paceibacterota bacterium]|jgi:hypothetical protein
MTSLQRFIDTFGAIMAGRETACENAPTGKLQPDGHKVLGVIEDPKLRALYSLTERIDAYIGDYVTANNIGSREGIEAIPIAKLKEHARHLQLTRAFLSDLRGILSVMIQEAFPGHDYFGTNIDLVEGWQVVDVERDDDLPIILEIPMAKKPAPAAE